MGLSETASVLSGVALQLGGFIGTLAMGWLIGRSVLEVDE